MISFKCASHSSAMHVLTSLTIICHWCSTIQFSNIEFCNLKVIQGIIGDAYRRHHGEEAGKQDGNKDLELHFWRIRYLILNKERNLIYIGGLYTLQINPIVIVQGCESSKGRLKWLKI